MNTLKGIFDNQKPPKRNFILENMKHIRTMRKVSDKVVSDDSVSRKVNNYSHVTAKVSTNLNSNLRTKGGSAIEMTNQCRNTYVPNRNSANSEMSCLRNHPKQFGKGQGSFIKSSASNKSQEILNSYENTDTYGKNNIKVFDMMSGIPPVPLISRSASLLDGSSHHLGQEERLRSTVSENQVHIESVRSLGCQTIPPDDVDRILNEGVIKYPSMCSVETISPELKVQRQISRPTTCDSALQTEIAIDKSTENTATSNSKHLVSVKILPPNNEVTSRKRLQKMFHLNKEKILNEVEIDEKLKGIVCNQKSLSQCLWCGGSRREKKHPDCGDPQTTYSGFEDDVSGDSQNCPDGHTFLPEVERAETLRMLRKSYEEHIKELNSLPVRTDTLKMRQRKIDLERQLNKLEEGIKIFSRPKVFVRIGI